MNRRLASFVLALGIAGSAISIDAGAAEPALAAPSGFQGAGLGLGEQRGRVWLETAFHAQKTYALVSPALGVGYRITEPLELEAIVPMAYASLRGAGRETGFGVGNPYLALNLIEVDAPIRYKVGLGVALPLGADEDEDATAVALTSSTFAHQDAQLWFVDALSIVVPARVETGDTVVVGLDAQLGLSLSEQTADPAESYLQAAPGLGIYALETLLLGLRAPISWAFTSIGNGDPLYLAAEPYARVDLDQAFLNARFTVNLNEPEGFSFEDDKVWGAHVGGGVTF